MSGLRDIFLKQFEDKWRTPLLDFSRRISESESDVLIFMARKAACLYHCLEDLKITHSSAICTTDLSLDGDLSWLIGKNVELVDDTLITGTTLCRTIQKLKDTNISSLKTTVFCVDRINWCKELVEPNQPFILAEPHEVTSFSAQTVRAIGVVPRPYLIDYPLFNGIRISSDSLDPILNITGWYVNELTSEAQSKTGAVVITMTPSNSTTKLFNEHLGWPCSEISQLLKIRLYSRLRHGNRPVYFCRAMPIVAFDPMTTAQLNLIWESLEQTYGEVIKELGAKLKTQKERLRVIQYICGKFLFDIWLSDIRLACSPSRVEFDIDFRQIDFTFPPNVRNHIVDILHSDLTCPLAKAPQIIEHPIPKRASNVIESRFEGGDLPSIQAKLVEPFENLFADKEIPARKLVKEHGINVFELKEYREIIDRLSYGISLPELRKSLDHINNPEAAKVIIPMFIDEAIDRGIAVPIIVDDGQNIYRAYRHGEDVKFTDVEARLSCIMMQEVCKVLGLKTLPKLVVEKLIVIFIKCGISLGFIDHWTGSLGDRRVVGIRYYLQGAIAQKSPDKYPYHYSPGDSLSSVFKSWGYLKGEGKHGYTIAEIPKGTPTTKASEKTTKALGATIGLALKEVPKNKRDDELTLISTCFGPMETVSALAAEIYYFEKHWTALSNVILGKNISNKSEKILRSHDVYRAVNSGIWKWRNYINNNTENIINVWRQRLDNDSGAVFTDAMLESAFSLSDTQIESAELNNLIEICGVWLIEANIALRKLRICLLKESNQSSVKELSSQVETLYNERENYISSIKDNSSLEALEFHNLKNDELADISEGNLLDSLSLSANMILDKVDAMVVPFGRPRNIYNYRHVLTVTFSPNKNLDDLYSQDILNEIKSLIKDAQKSNLNSGLHVLTQPRDLWHADYAIASTGQYGRELLIKVIKILLDSIHQDVKCRFCFWAELEADERVIRAENSSDVTARNLLLRIEEVNEKLPENIAENHVIIFSSRNDRSLNSVIDDLHKHVKQNLRSISQDDLIIDNPISRKYKLNTISLEREENSKLKKSDFDIGIITVVSEEMNAVINLLKTGKNFNKIRDNNFVYYKAELPSEGDEPHNIIATQQVEQGNRSVMTAYERLCQNYNPSMIILLGIGGSIDPDIELCDVVIADQVIWYEQATEAESEIKRKGESTKLVSWLKVLLNEFFSENGYPFVINKEKQNRKVYLAPIGTGEKVIRYRDSETRKWLKSFNYKCMALETEAGGIAQAFYENENRMENGIKGYMIIRGISDHADKDKDDSCRSLASINACYILEKFLSSIPSIKTYLNQSKN